MTEENKIVYCGKCAMCKYFFGELVGQCKHPELKHPSFVLRGESCLSGELDPSILLQFRYGADEVTV
jgi:hypothetical protein